MHVTKIKRIQTNNNVEHVVFILFTWYASCLLHFADAINFEVDLILRAIIIYKFNLIEFFLSREMYIVIKS